MRPRKTQFCTRRARNPGGCSTGGAPDGTVASTDMKTGPVDNTGPPWCHSHVIERRAEGVQWGERAVRHLQELIRIDTTNPPGNETPAAEYLGELLSQAGLEPTLLGAVPERKCVVARPRGEGRGVDAPARARPPGPWVDAARGQRGGAARRGGGAPRVGALATAPHARGGRLLARGGRHAEVPAVAPAPQPACRAHRRHGAQ